MFLPARHHGMRRRFLHRHNLPTRRSLQQRGRLHLGYIDILRGIRLWSIELLLKLFEQ